MGTLDQSTPAPRSAIPEPTMRTHFSPHNSPRSPLRKHIKPLPNLPITPDPIIRAQPRPRHILQIRIHIQHTLIHLRIRTPLLFPTAHSRTDELLLLELLAPRHRHAAIVLVVNVVE